MRACMARPGTALICLHSIAMQATRLTSGSNVSTQQASQVSSAELACKFPNPQPSTQPREYSCSHQP